MRTETRSDEVLSAPATDVFKRFDDEYGYGAWSRFCRDKLNRALPPDEASAFRDSGVEILRPFSAAETAKVLAHVKQIEKIGSNVFSCEDYITHIVLPKRDYVRMLFMKLFSKEMDRRIAAFFGSEYQVMWFSFCRTVANSELTDSFLWHKDAGPSRHVKVILYLNGTKEHGARTDFLDSESSARLGKVGYDFLRLKDRRDTLDPFVHAAGIDFKPLSPVVEPGEAILFKPSLVLHRGIFPTQGPRYTLTLCLLPSPEPWHVHFDTCEVRKLQEVEATAWSSAPWITKEGLTIG